MQTARWRKPGYTLCPSVAFWKGSPKGVILLAFRCWRETPKENNLEERRLMLAHCFRGASLWPTGSIAWARGEEKHGGRKMLCSWQAGSRERGRGKGQMQFSGPFPKTLFL